MHTFQSHDTCPMMINLAHFPITPNSGYFRWPWIWNERKSVQNSNLVNRKSAFFVWFEPLNQKREANKILLRLLIRAKTQPKTKSEKYGNLPSVGFATSLPQNDARSPRYDKNEIKNSQNDSKTADRSADFKK